MKKSQIETHSDGFRPSHPAVNVKDRSPYILPKLMAHFRCCEATALSAHETAFRWHQESFWDSAQEQADHHLGAGFKIYSEGRQGGWLVVHGLPEVETWDAIRVSAWSRFAKAIRAEVDYQTGFEAIRDTIEANDLAPADALLDDKDAEAEEQAHWEAREVETVNT